jgi:hypothetical protein
MDTYNRVIFNISSHTVNHIFISITMIEVIRGSKETHSKISDLLIT